MKHALLLLASLGLATTAQAQSPTAAPPTFTWAAAYSIINQTSTTGAASMHAAATVAANGEVWVNVPDSVAIVYGGKGLGRQRLERRRADGSLAFSRQLPGRSTLSQLRTAPNGRLYLLGYYLQSVTLDAAHVLSTTDTGPHDFLACLDATGTVLYARDLTATGARFVGPKTLVPTATGVYVGFPANASGNTLIQQFDAQGVVINTLTQTGGMSVTGLDLDATGTLFVTGTCLRAAGGTFNGTAVMPTVGGNGYNQYVACYAPSGTLRWVKFIGDVTCASPQVRSDGAGGVYWLTSLTDAATFGGFTMPGPATGSTEDYLLARLNAAGTVQWAHDVATSSTASAGMGQHFSLDTDAAGNLYLAGQTRGLVQWTAAVQTNAGTTGDLLVQRISPAGVVEWARTAGGSQGYVYGGTLAVAPDGTVLVTGIGNGPMTFDALTLPSVSRYHHFVVRLTPAARPTATATAQAGTWQLAPNPTTTRCTLHPPSGQGLVRAELFDALGRRLASSTSETPDFDLSGQAPGVYVVRATSATSVWMGRVVKE